MIKPNTARVIANCLSCDPLAVDALRDLAQQVEDLQKDAGRYRWLREQPNNTDAPRIDVVYWQQEDEASNAGSGLRTEELDQAIDEAMK